MPPPPDEDGPDGSSIKPVSSLRARFENMSKADASDAHAVSPHVSPLPAPLSRPISPAPKPDRLRGPASPTLGGLSLAAPPPPTKAKPRDPSLALIPAAMHSPAVSTPVAAPDSPGLLGNTGLVRPSNRLGPPPPLSPRPIAPPSLLVQPPQSPPKGRAGHLVLPSGADHSSLFLNPDSVVMAPLSPSSSPRLPRIPSRPHTPTTLDARRSPRLSPSQPPSPPPRRRSAELKREREQRDQRDHKAAPPPINRVDKPKIPSQHLSPFVPPRPPASPAALSNGSPPGNRTAAERTSPFGTPSSSSDSLDEDQPPMLPARPRSQLPPERTAAPRPRPRSMAVPPTADAAATSLHSMSGAARLGDPGQDKIPNGMGVRGHPSPQIEASDNVPSDARGKDDHRFERPPLPTRPTASGASHAQQQQQQQQQPPARAQIPASTRLPPRPRLGDNHVHSNGSAPSNGGPVASSDSQMPPPPPPLGKRVASNPTTSTQHFPPPPTRTQHGRSMTVDRATAKFSSDLRSSSSSFVPPPSGASTPAEVASRSTDALVAVTSSAKPHDSHPAASFPDATNINRRPPFAKQGLSEISTRLECRQMDVYCQKVATTGQLTRVWSLVDGELLLSMSHGEGIRATCVAFKPGAHVDDEGLRLWIGNMAGELMEADIATQSIVASRPGAHGRHEIIKIHRHCNELWTLCDGGALFVWGPSGEAGVPSLGSSQHQSFRVPRGHTYSLVVGDELWHAAGRELRVFLPTVDGSAQFQILLRALTQEGAGEITSGTVLLSEPDKVFLGHTDGKVSIYSRSDYTCVGLVSLGSYKVNTLASAGPYIWAGFNTGHLCVYDPSATPWVVKKDWAAHDNPVVRLVSDRASSYRSGYMQVLSLGADNMLRVWDGLLQDDWLEEAMQARDESYCDLDRIRAHVMTWNAGASTPGSLRYSDGDAAFMQSMLRESGKPDIFVFGFQELVDLEDKTATAKRFLKVNKKKEGSDQERMSHQYRDWRDFLVRCLDDFMEGELYQLLQTSHMVGLFTCIFVRADVADRIRNVATAEVKRGMGGLHGNKGAIAIRFLLDDTSLCFVNCHLAAGQSQAASRHNDAAAILDSAGLPMERDAGARIDSYTGGGDGTMILDHELCILNGDLNYRIDTMSRDTVVNAVRAGNLAKLLERDQLLVARRRNAGFRLRAFEELPIRFDPTYKYDVGTDTYDSSEKKRSPAWCDRLLYRGGRHARVFQFDYRRHDVRVSDHRPVTGRFEFTVKQVDAKRRAVAWMECQQHLEDHREQVCHQEKMHYLTQVIGYDEATSEDLIRERSKRRVRRSPSRHHD